MHFTRFNFRLQLKGRHRIGLIPLKWLDEAVPFKRRRVLLAVTMRFPLGALPKNQNWLKVLKLVKCIGQPDIIERHPSP